jgi:hypothetical protein
MSVISVIARPASPRSRSACSSKAGSMVLGRQSGLLQHRGGRQIEQARGSWRDEAFSDTCLLPKNRPWDAMAGTEAVSTLYMQSFAPPLPAQPYQSYDTPAQPANYPPGQGPFGFGTHGSSDQQSTYGSPEGGAADTSTGLLRGTNVPRMCVLALRVARSIPAKLIATPARAAGLH